MSRFASTSAAPDASLAEAEKKMKLVESDRKAYFEAAQVTINQNKTVMESVKRENRELRDAISKILRESSGASSSVQEKEAEELTAKIRELKAAADTTRFETVARERELNTLKDQFRDLERECAPAVTEDSPLTKQIRTLENRLEKAVIKHNEALSIRKTYEQIVKRLKEERVGFDNQLSAIERTLKAKVHDHEELEAMCHDALHARDVARAELANFKKFVDEQRDQRLKELAEKRQLLSQRVDATKRMQEKIEERERASRDSQNQGSADKHEDGLTAEARAKRDEEELRQYEERISEYERIFRVIKDATGVSDVNLVIQKFLTQEDTRRNLQNLVQEGQSKIDSLSSERNDLKRQLEELKYSGTGSLGSRRIVDEFEEHLNEAKAKAERNRKKYERVAKIFIDVKAGIEHLADKLEVVTLDGGDASRARSAGTGEVVDVLGQLQEKLVAIAKRVAEEERTDQAALLQRSMDLSTTMASLELPATNIRIKLPTAEDEDSGEEAVSSEGEEEVMNREQLKRIAHMTIEKTRRKPKKKKSKKSAE